jgi:hypothetical protein
MSNECELPAAQVSYPAYLGGCAVYCDSMQDAEAVNRAGLILDGGEAGPFAPSALEHLADVLNKYGRTRAARILLDRHRASSGLLAEASIER